MAGCKNPELGNLLLAYELGGLSDPEIERFEAHLIECDHCFHELVGFEREADLLSRDKDIRRLIIRGAHQEGNFQPSFLHKVWRHIWPESPVIFKPALAYLLIILMIIPAYRGLTRFSGDNIRTVQTLNLIPDRTVGQEVIKIGIGSDGLINFVYRGAVPGQDYRITIESEDGKMIFRDDNFDAFDEYETGRLLLPITHLNPGIYRLVIVDPRIEPPLNWQEYSFRVER